MKKPLLCIALAAAAVAGHAQVVEVQSIEQIPVKGELMVDIPQISPDGSFVVVSNHTSSSLDRIDLATSAVTPLTDNGTALHLQFSPDGSTVVYRKAETRPDHRRFYTLETSEVAGGYTRTLAAPSRRSTPFSVSASGMLAFKADGKLSVRRIGRITDPVATVAPVVGIYHGHLEVTYPDGTTRYLDPQGKGSYLWPTLSPDCTKIAYYLSGRGCYVCNVDGSDSRALGYIHAPRWIDNATLVGQQDYDDGSQLISSAIVAADLNGNIQTLTPADIYGFNPSASADGKKIAFSTVDGKLYVITLR